MQKNISQVWLRRIGVGLLVASALLTLLSFWLGWLPTGDRVRNSFEMFKVQQSFDYNETVAKFTPLRILWFLLPVLIGLGLLLLVLKWFKTSFFILSVCILIPAVIGVFLWKFLGLQSGHLFSVVGVIGVTLSGLTFFICWLVGKKSAAVDIS